jgi:hypothetical protein
VKDTVQHRETKKTERTKFIGSVNITMPMTLTPGLKKYREDERRQKIKGER